MRLANIIYSAILALGVGCATQQAVRPNFSVQKERAHSRFFNNELEYLKERNISLEVAERYNPAFCANEIVYFVNNNISPEESLAYVSSSNPIEDYELAKRCQELRSNPSRQKTDKGTLLDSLCKMQEDLDTLNEMHAELGGKPEQEAAPSRLRCYEVR